jgi:hypothetical protein
MIRTTSLRIFVFSSLMSVALLAGCKSDEQKALDQAQSQAATTKAPQQVQYIDKDGNTVTTIVQPPNSSQAQSTTKAPPAPGTHPAATAPVITPVNEAVLSAQQAAQNPAPTTQEVSTPTQAAGVAPMNGAPPPPLNLTVPEGTEMAIRINQDINVKHTVAGDRFTGEIVEPVSRNGIVLIPRGTPVRGRVDAAHRRGHFKGSSILELRLTSMTMNGNEYALDTHDNVRTKKGKGKRTTGFIAGMTGAGMIIGGVASGGVGLGIGAAAGAGAGTLIAGTTGNRDINIPAESIVHFRLADDLVVQSP